MIALHVRIMELVRILETASIVLVPRNMKETLAKPEVCLVKFLSNYI